MSKKKRSAIVPVETRSESKRQLFIEGDIESETAMNFIKDLIQLSETDDQSPVTVFINSPGGSVNAGFLICDAIRGCGLPVKTVCLGRAFSIAAVIFSSGTGGRVILPHSEVLIHEPSFFEDNARTTNVTGARKMTEQLTKVKDKIVNELAEFTGHTPEDIEAAFDDDHYFTAEESVEFGLCDEIIDFKKAIA